MLVLKSGIHSNLFYFSWKNIQNLQIPSEYQAILNSSFLKQNRQDMSNICSLSFWWVNIFTLYHCRQAKWERVVPAVEMRRVKRLPREHPSNSSLPEDCSDCIWHSLVTPWMPFIIVRTRVEKESIFIDRMNFKLREINRLAVRISVIEKKKKGWGE